MGSCCAGSALCPTAVSCRRPRSRERASAPPTRHRWTRKTTTPDLTIITTITNTDTAALTTSMLYVASTRTSFITFSKTHSRGMCLPCAIIFTVLVNLELTCPWQAEWELESWAGAGTVETEVNKHFSFQFINKHHQFMLTKFLRHSIVLAAINRLQSRRRLQRRNQNWRWSHQMETGTIRVVILRIRMKNLNCQSSSSFLSPISSSITQSMDSGGTDNFILISQLKEEVMSLKRLLQQRDQTILEKDRKVGSLVQMT